MVIGWFLACEALGLDVHRNIFIIAITIGIVVPLCLLKDLSALQYSSMIGTVSVVYLISLLFYRTATTEYTTFNNSTTIHVDWFSFTGWPIIVVMNKSLRNIVKKFISLSILFKSYVIHYAAIQMYGVLEYRTPQNFFKITALTYFIVCIIYCAIGFCGLLL